LLYLTVGLLLWAFYLTLVYGMHTLACARDYVPLALFGIDWPSMVILVAGILASGALAGMILYLPKPRSSRDDTPEERVFQNRVMRWSAALAIFGIAWTGLSALFVPLCHSLR
jgi:hypothetical protein